MNAPASAAEKKASDFLDSVVLVAGTCDATATAIARDLAARGAAVGLCGAERTALDRLAREITAAGGTAFVAATEGTAAGTIPDAVDRVLSQFGRIDVLINNPGARPARLLSDLSLDEFQATLDSIVTPSFALAHAVVPSMRRHRYGRIINIYSLSYLGLPAQANTSAAHAAIFGLTRSIALETAVDGITVNAVVTGDIAGPEASAADAEKLAGQIPVRRAGAPADAAYAIRFFAARSTKYVTGQTLFVCGGKSAYFSMSV